MPELRWPDAAIGHHHVRAAIPRPYVLSSPDLLLTVMAVETNEELMVARQIAAIIEAEGRR